MGAIKGKTLATQTCPLCNNFSTKRLTTLTQHFIDIHGTSAEDVWAKMNGGRPSCACGCGGLTTWHGWGKGWGKVIIGHNGSIYAVYSAEEAAKISAARSAALTGKVGWCKGLTKDTDKRIADRGVATALGRKEAFDAGDIIAWNKGLTKETDVRVADAAASLKQKFSTGEVVPWAKGLTKETDERVEKMASSVSLSMQNSALRLKLDSIKRLSIDDVKQRIESSGELTVVDGLQGYINDASRVIIVKCNKCGVNTQGSLRMLGKGRCFQCAPGGSIAQESVAKYIEGLGVEVKRNDRKAISLELDVYIKNLSFAVEYNGLFWHSHVNKPSNYHSNKTKVARSYGIQLLHIFEDEWRDKRSIVESMIISRLNLSSIKIGARKCEVKQLSVIERREFFNESHIDGDVSCEIAWGLVSNNVIVYALSLRKPFHKKYSSSIEISRCCPKKGHNVQGGLSKLIKVAIEYSKSNGRESIMTYVDTRLGGFGKGYELAGLKQTDVTVPRWWWTDMDNRFNRFKFKADPSTGRSEAEVAVDAKVVKIWGCENVVYSMIL